MMQFRHRTTRLLGAMLAVAALAGCQNLGESALDAEVARVRGNKYFRVISSTPGRAVFSAHGQKVIVEPPQGYCLDNDSLAVNHKAAFVLVADCLEASGVELAQGTGQGKVVEITLPRVFPGILTVSISGASAFGQEPGALDAFEELLGGDDGLNLLSRGKNTAQGKIIATRRIGGALYVLIEEASAGKISILAPRFWRAFIDINERLVLVTVSSFSDRSIAEDAMMGFLAQQIAALRRANGLQADAEEDEISASMVASLDLAGGQGGFSLIRSPGAAVTSDGIDPARSPMPQRRRQIASANVQAGGGSTAPTRAPAAPQRPG
jgi:hypothetical protein